jgi:YbbR domain-containing protein
MGVLRFLFGDIGLKILALLIAVFIWFVAILNREYVTSYRVPVALDNIETRKIISEFETRHAEVAIAGKGSELVTLRLKTPKFSLTVPEGRAGVVELRLNAADLDLPAGLTVRSVTPEFIELRLNEVGTRTVAVDVPTRGRPAEGLTISSVRPFTKVELIGPEDDVRLFSRVYTESLDLGRVRTTDTVALRVLPPDAEGFSTDPETVAVVIEVEKEAARIFLGIPVRTSPPDGRDVTVEPEAAQVVVAGPSSRLDELKPAQVRARIDASTLEAGEHQLAADILLPPEFHLVRCEPARFRVIVR